MDHDAAWKRLFGIPIVAEHLLRGFAGPAAGCLDFATLRKLPASWVGADAEQRHGDAAWRAKYADGSGRSLVMLLEFQSGIDPVMDERVLRYAGMARTALRRQNELDADGEARVLPVVVYSGDRQWSALGAAPGVGLTAGGEVLLAPPKSYLLLDALRLAEDDLPRRNIVSAVFEAVAAESLEGSAAPLLSLWSWLPDEVGGDRCRAVMEVVADWLVMATGTEHGSAEAKDIRRMLVDEEITMGRLAERVRQQREDWFQNGVETGLERGLAAERELLRRLAKRKFDESTAGALVRHLASLTDAARLAEAGELIIDCETGTVLLDRLARISRQRQR